MDNISLNIFAAESCGRFYWAKHFPEFLNFVFNENNCIKKTEYTSVLDRSKLHLLSVCLFVHTLRNLFKPS